MHAYQSPKGDDCPLTAGLPPPGPRGAPPPPCRFALGGSPCYLPSGRSVCKNHGGSFSRSERSGSRLLAGGQLLAVVHGATPKGKRRGAKAPPGIQLQGRDPQAGGGEAAPKPRGSRLSVGKCSESTYRRKWQNGGMAHFAILRVQKLKSAVAVHRSMKHSFRAQDTPNADAELTHLNEHFGAHSVAEGMAAFRSRLPESFRKDAVQAVEYLITASPSAMQGKPKASRTPTSGTR